MSPWWSYVCRMINDLSWFHANPRSCCCASLGPWIGTTTPTRASSRPHRWRARYRGEERAQPWPWKMWKKPRKSGDLKGEIWKNVKGIVENHRFTRKNLQTMENTGDQWDWMQRFGQGKCRFCVCFALSKVSSGFFTRVKHAGLTKEHIFSGKKIYCFFWRWPNQKIDHHTCNKSPTRIEVLHHCHHPSVAKKKQLHQRSPAVE